MVPSLNDQWHDYLQKLLLLNQELLFDRYHFSLYTFCNDLVLFKSTTFKYILPKLIYLSLFIIANNLVVAMIITLRVS